MNKIAVFFILLAYGMTCGCKAYKERILRKYCTTDTLIVRDTIRTQTVQHDTAFVDIPRTDTLVITKDKLVIRYFKKDSIVYISGECKGDTVYIEKRISVPRALPVQSFWQRAYNTGKEVFSWLGLILLVALLLRFLIK
jgi:hypothetical protein